MATLNDFKTNLFSYFANNDTLTIEEYFKQPSVISVDKELDSEILRAALKEYENQGLITRLEYQLEDGLKKECWVLNKPIQSYSQNIELSYETIDAITKFVNTYCEETKNKQSLVNPLSITERDLQAVLVIAHGISNESNE